MKAARTIIASATMLCLAVCGVARADVGISAVKFTPVPCHKARCDATDLHGRVELTFADSRHFAVAGDYVFKGREGEHPSEGPQIAPDHHTVGWLQGEHLTHQGSVIFLPTRLVIYRDMKPYRSIAGKLPFIEGWHFVDGAHKVVFQSRALHGVSWVTLYDLDKQKVVGQILGYKIKSSSPSWTKEFAD